MYADLSSLITIIGDTFVNNFAHYGGGVVYSSASSFSISNSSFLENSATNGGVLSGGSVAIDIINRTFANNLAHSNGGVVYSSASPFSISNSSFLENSATDVGGVLYIFRGGSVDITNSSFNNNSAVHGASGVIFSAGHSFLNITYCSFYANKAKSYGGIMSTVNSSSHIADCMFNNNLGSLYIFSSNLTFGHNITIVSGDEPMNKVSTDDTITEPRPEGGALTSLLSTLIFTGESNLSNNRAKHGGAILASESKIVMYGKTMIANNMGHR